MLNQPRTDALTETIVHRAGEAGRFLPSALTDANVSMISSRLGSEPLEFSCRLTLLAVLFCCT